MAFVEMERRQEEKRRNEGRPENEKAGMAHPGKPVEMETTPWWSAELGWARAGWGRGAAHRQKTGTFRKAGGDGDETRKEETE